MQKIFGEDVLYHGGPKYHNPKDSSLFLSLGRHVDVYFPPRKRSRVSAPFVFCGEMFKKRQTTIDSLPDECLFEIFRRVSGSQEKEACASVSKHWLMLLSTIRKDEICVSQRTCEDIDKSGGCLKRCLKGKKATDIRLAAIAVGTGSHGGLNELSILGDDGSRVTDFGLKAVSRGCPSLTALTICSLSSVGDEGLVEITKGCHALEKLNLSQCPSVSDKSLVAIANNCPNLTSLAIESCSNIGNEGLQAIGRACRNLKSVSIKNCPKVGDQGIAGLLSSAGCSLTKLKLHALSIGDVSLAVIGHYGIEVNDLVFSGLRNVTEKGFWVMANGQGLHKLKSFSINSCCGVTDVGIEAVGKGCPNLKQFCICKSGFMSDAGIVSFAKAAKSLEILVVNECPRITQLGLFGLLVNCGKLKDLSLVSCPGIKDLSLRPVSALSPCNSLRSLSVHNCPGFGNFSLEFFGFLCPHLQNITFTGLQGITDQGFVPLIQNCKADLTKINLSGCVNLTDKVVSEIVNLHGDTLEVLKLEGCRFVTDASLVAIADKCILLGELDVSKSSITDSGLAALACAVHSDLKILSVSSCCLLSDKSIPFLMKMGDTLLGLNLLQCSGISDRAVGLMVDQMWNCDILY